MVRCQHLESFTKRNMMFVSMFFEFLLQRFIPCSFYMFANTLLYLCSFLFGMKLHSTLKLTMYDLFYICYILFLYYLCYPQNKVCPGPILYCSLLLWGLQYHPRAPSLIILCPISSTLPHISCFPSSGCCCHSRLVYTMVFRFVNIAFYIK